MPDAHHYIPIAFYLPPIAIIISAAILQSLQIWLSSGFGNTISKKKVVDESKISKKMQDESKIDSKISEMKNDNVDLNRTDMFEFGYLTMPFGMNSFSTLNRPQYIPLLTMSLVHLFTIILFLGLNPLLLILVKSPSSNVFNFIIT
jgi:hypothetical protein